MRIVRLLSLLFACSLAPIVFADPPVLVLTQVGSYEAALPGSIVGIPVSFANLGTADAWSVRLTMTIPPHATFVGGCPGWANVEFGDIVCTISSLPGRYTDSRETVELDFMLDPKVPLGPLSFPVSLTCDNAPNVVDRDTATIQVVAPADVSIAMTSPSVVSGGTVYDNVVTVTNNGPGEALPKVELRFDNSVPKALDGTAAWTCTTSGPVVDCTATSPLEPGSTTFTFTAIAPPSGSMTQTASMSLVNDTNLQDNQATTTTAVIPEDLPPAPAVTLTLTAVPDIVHPGDLLTYTAKITNTSNLDAQSVILTWELPGTVVSTTCDIPTNKTCFFSTIAAGATQTATRTIRVDAAPGPQVLGSATVTSPNIPFDPNTDAAALWTPFAAAPTQQADVSVTVDAAPATLQTGDVVTFTLTAKNGGTSEAAGDVTVNFFLPNSLAFLSASPGCKGTAAIICTVGTLDSGALATLSVTARAVAPGSITATASVTTTSPEANSGNNSGSATIVVNPPPAPARRRAARH